jgi:5'-3' exonuclease
MGFCRAWGGVVSCPLSDLRGGAVAIDACEIIYNLKYKLTRESLEYMDPFKFQPQGDDMQDRLRLALLDLVGTYASFNILPVFIFDGSPPDSKEDVVVARRARLERTTREIEQLLERPHTPASRRALRTLLFRSVYVHNSCFRYLGDCLRRWSIPHAWAIGEADGAVANMVLCGDQVFGRRVDWVSSRDTDLLVHGVERLVIEVYGNSCAVVKLSRVLDNTALSANQFIHMCCVASEAPRRMNLRRAMALVKQPDFLLSEAQAAVAAHYQQRTPEPFCEEFFTLNIKELRATITATKTMSTLRHLEIIHTMLMRN